MLCGCGLLTSGLYSWARYLCVFPLKYVGPEKKHLISYLVWNRQGTDQGRWVVEGLGVEYLTIQYRDFWLTLCFVPLLTLPLGCLGWHKVQSLWITFSGRCTSITSWVGGGDATWIHRMSDWIWAPNKPVIFMATHVSPCLSEPTHALVVQLSWVLMRILPCFSKLCFIVCISGQLCLFCRHSHLS